MSQKIINHACTTGAPVFTGKQIKVLESHAAGVNAVGLSVLMERAGAALFKLIRKRSQVDTHLHIVCGSGNNGGDGFVLADLAIQASENVTVYIDKQPTGNDAEVAYTRLLNSGVRVKSVREFNPTSGVIVDCIFGTGLRSAPREPWLSCIDKINTLNLPVYAADIPSGLCADTGHAQGCVVQADTTLTFIGLKPGLLTGVGPAVCGELVVDDLKVDIDAVTTDLQLINKSQFKGMLRTRPRDSHKGNFGHVLVVGGDSGFGGAALLSASSALRTGAGLVSVITHPDHAATFLASRPELMVNGLASVESNRQRVDDLLNQAIVIVLGPGLGQGAFGSGFYNYVMQHVQATHKPVVLDADALNLLALHPTEVPSAVLTPHPGEAGRLLQKDTLQINVDRIAAVKEIAIRYAAVSLLKGAGSLISSGGTVSFSDTGNPGMASGGMGDVLSGIVAGLIAQCLVLEDALCFGVWLHGSAGDSLATRDGEVGLLAGDLINEVRCIVNSMQI